MRASTVVRPERIHRGVVICNIDDILPEGWQDWMAVPTWPPTVHDTIFGLTPLRWKQMADRARTLQEREVASALGDHSTVAEVAGAMRLSQKRVAQIARGLFDRVAKPPAAAHQMDMFEDDGGDQ